MSLPHELYAHEVIRYLPVKDILTLCQTSPTLYSICQENSTWKFLIGRDYGIEYQGKNPREYYMKAKRIHDMSDILVEMLEGRKDFESELSRIGYKRNGNVYVLSGLDPYQEFHGLESRLRKVLFGEWRGGEIFVAEHDPPRKIWDDFDLFPNVFYLDEGRRFPVIKMALPDFVEIYEFYSGESFWTKFLKHLSNSIYDYNEEQIKIRTDILKLLYDYIYNGLSTTQLDTAIDQLIIRYNLSPVPSSDEEEPDEEFD